jgi:hypothetical protein
MLSKILVSRLISCVDSIVGDHKSGFRRKRSATD